MPKLLWDEVAAIAAARPGHLAILTDDAALTYGEMVMQAADRAARLQVAGLRRGDRVALIAGNSPGYLIWAFAVWRAGGVAATVYPDSSAGELDYVLANARPTLVVTDAER